MIKSCGLDVDLAQLRDGDDAIVGDRGVQLSGGQVSRVVVSWILGPRPKARHLRTVTHDFPLYLAREDRVGSGLLPRCRHHTPGRSSIGRRLASRPRPLLLGDTRPRGQEGEMRRPGHASAPIHRRLAVHHDERRSRHVRWLVSELRRGLGRKAHIRGTA